MMQIMVKLSQELAEAVRSPDRAKASDLLEAIGRHGAKIGSATGVTGESSLYFPVDNVDAGLSESLRRSLSDLPGVDAAYLRPSDELP